MRKTLLVIVLALLVFVSGCSLSPTSSNADDFSGDIADSTSGNSTTNYDTEEYRGIYNAIRVSYLSDRQIQHDDESKYYTLFFSLQDSDSERIPAPATVSIKIINDNNETVYNAVKTIKEDDYAEWSSSIQEARLLASINIYDNEISEGSVSSGDVYFTVANTGYFAFEETSLPITDDLPTKQTIIKLPEMPEEVNTHSYDGRVSATVKITSIKYEIERDNIYFYFTGVKTYDKEGAYNSSYCYVGWKLYDSDGYVVDSGTLITDKLYTDEKFRDKKEYAFGCITPGETYTLRISSVD